AGFCTIGLVALLAYTPTAAQEGKGKAVKVGDKAPVFTSVDESGKTWKSIDHVGKKIVVLYFYPADFTGGCTSQACGYRDAIDKSGNVAAIDNVAKAGEDPKRVAELIKKLDTK